ncbi:hypothetical protein CCACVL1_14721, partial [Corchorus capsularis]
IHSKHYLILGLGKFSVDKPKRWFAAAKAGAPMAMLVSLQG